jgi:hypothetical protein
MMSDGGTIMSRVGCSAPSDALLTWLDEEGASLTVRPPTACPPLFLFGPDTCRRNLRISTACSLHFKSS